MEINVLGSGCPKCHQTETNIKQALQESGMDAKIIKVTGAVEIASYGVFTTPAVVIDGKVKCTGKVPEKDEIKNWFSE